MAASATFCVLQGPCWSRYWRQRLASIVYLRSLIFCSIRECPATVFMLHLYTHVSPSTVTSHPFVHACQSINSHFSSICTRMSGHQQSLLIHLYTHVSPSTVTSHPFVHACQSINSHFSSICTRMSVHQQSLLIHLYTHVRPSTVTSHLFVHACQAINSHFSSICTRMSGHQQSLLICLYTHVRPSTVTSHLFANFSIYLLVIIINWDSWLCWELCFSVNLWH